MCWLLCVKGRGGPDEWHLASCGRGCSPPSQSQGQGSPGQSPPFCVETGPGLPGTLARGVASSPGQPAAPQPASPAPCHPCNGGKSQICIRRLFPASLTAPHYLEFHPTYSGLDKYLILGLPNSLSQSCQPTAGAWFRLAASRASCQAKQGLMSGCPRRTGPGPRACLDCLCSRASVRKCMLLSSSQRPVT